MCHSCSESDVRLFDTRHYFPSRLFTGAPRPALQHDIQLSFLKLPSDAHLKVILNNAPSYKIAIEMSQEGIARHNKTEILVLHVTHLFLFQSSVAVWVLSLVTVTLATECLHCTVPYFM